MNEKLGRHVGNPNSELWQTAMHEAAHAVVMLAFGGAFRSATARKHGELNGHVDLDGGIGLEAPDRAVVLAAGVFGEWIAAGRTDEAAQCHGGGHDEELVYQLADANGFNADATYLAARVLVEILLPLVEIVAMALIVPSPLRALSCEEVEAALEAWPDAWDDAQANFDATFSAATSETPPVQVHPRDVVDQSSREAVGDYLRLWRPAAGAATPPQ